MTIVHAYLLASLIVCTAIVTAVEEEDSVLVLEADNFDEIVQANELVLVMFYAPWCGHCKELAPDYTKVAKALKDVNSLIKLAKIDASRNKEFTAKFKVRGYPTLKLFRNGVPDAEYMSGVRDAVSILEWLKKETFPPVREMLRADEVTVLAERVDVAIFGFFENKRVDGVKVFYEVAKKHKDLLFALYAKESEKYLDSEIQSRNSESEFPHKIFLLKKFDEKRVNFDEEVF